MSVFVWGLEHNQEHLSRKENPSSLFIRNSSGRRMRPGEHDLQLFQDWFKSKPKELKLQCEDWFEKRVNGSCPWGAELLSPVKSQLLPLIAATAGGENRVVVGSGLELGVSAACSKNWFYSHINVGRSCWHSLLEAIFTDTCNHPKLCDTFWVSGCRRSPS